VLRLSRYERKEMENRRFRSNAVSLVGRPPPTNHFRTVSYPNECLTTLPLTVFTQRHFVADFLQAKCDCFTEIGRYAFLSPLFGELRGNVR